MKAVLTGILTFVVVARAENCGRVEDCFMQLCADSYVTQCLDSVCTCEPGTTEGLRTTTTAAPTAECLKPADCEQTHGQCNFEDHGRWYCLSSSCCCGELCEEAIERFHCSSNADCVAEFHSCPREYQYWRCRSGRCDCGSDN